MSAMYIGTVVPNRCTLPPNGITAKTMSAGTREMIGAAV